MIKVFTLNNKRFGCNGVETIQKHIKKRTKLFILVKDPGSEELSLLQSTFSLHPTTIRDFSSPQVRIKYDEFDNNTYIVLKGVKEIKDGRISFYTIYILDGKNYLLVVYYDENDTLDNLTASPKKIESLLKKGEDYILHYIVDKEVEKYIDHKNMISDEIKDIEEKFDQMSGKKGLKDFFFKEKILLEIKQRADSMTDVCLGLMKPTENYIDNDLIPYFRDVYDHAYRVSESLKTYHERFNSIWNTHLSLSSFRMNDNIRILTIVMALMMPATIITGFYGMNVHLPLQENRNAFILIMAFMFVVVLSMIYIFRKIERNL